MACASVPAQLSCQPRSAKIFCQRLRYSSSRVTRRTRAPSESRPLWALGDGWRPKVLVHFHIGEPQVRGVAKSLLLTTTTQLRKRLRKPEYCRDSKSPADLPYL